jgi:hypothetical protein
VPAITVNDTPSRSSATAAAVAWRAARILPPLIDVEQSMMIISSASPPSDGAVMPDAVTVTIASMRVAFSVR